MKIPFHFPTWKLLPLLLLGLTGLARAAEPTTAELVVQLQAAVAKALQEPAAKERDAREANGNYTQMYMDQLEAAVSNAHHTENLSGVEELAVKIQKRLPNEDVQRLSTALTRQLRAEIATSQRSATTKTDAEVDQAVAACFAAKEPKDLDALIMKLSQATKRPYTGSSFDPSNRAAEKARAVVAFLCRWQDYLLQQNGGNTDAAQAILVGISDDSNIFPFVPRSEILKRIIVRPEAKDAPPATGK